MDKHLNSCQLREHKENIMKIKTESFLNISETFLQGILNLLKENKQTLCLFRKLLLDI